MLILWPGLTRNESHIENLLQRQDERVLLVKTENWPTFGNSMVFGSKLLFVILRAGFRHIGNFKVILGKLWEHLMKPFQIIQ